MTDYLKKYFTLEGLEEQNLMFEGYTDGTVTNCVYTPLFSKAEMVRIVEVNSVLENA